MRVGTVTFALVFAASATTAMAQTAPISRTIPLTFTGVVTSTANDTIMVRQPDGTMTHYTGPLPDLPYANGDAVSISFNATLPTRAFYDTAYVGQKAADGIYRITLTVPYYSGPTVGGIGNSTAADVSGPIVATDNSGQPTNTRMTIVYDYNTDSYSIEGGGGFISGAYGGPGLIYDAASGQYVPCSGSVACKVHGTSDPILFNLIGGSDGTTISTGNIRIASTDPTSGTGTGFFSWLFSGSWNLPQYGGSTQVPEPGMLALFGTGVLALAMGRRRRRLAA